MFISIIQSSWYFKCTQEELISYICNHKWVPPSLLKWHFIMFHNNIKQRSDLNWFDNIQIKSHTWPNQSNQVTCILVSFQIKSLAKIFPSKSIKPHYRQIMIWIDSDWNREWFCPWLIYIVLLGIYFQSWEYTPASLSNLGIYSGRYTWYMWLHFKQSDCNICKELIIIHITSIVHTVL